MRAAAIVMPLPRRVNGASLFGKTLETVLAERPCRVIIESSADAGERRKRRSVALQEALRVSRRRAVLPLMLVLVGARAHRAHARRGRRPAGLRAARSACCSSPRARAALPGAAALMPRSAPPRRRLQAAATRRAGPRCASGLGSPALFGIVQGFIAASIYFSTGAGRRARARADLGRLPGRRRAVRADRRLLRRGRVAAPGARRRDGDRPLRVQRAVELHRRLGDLPRLPDPRRAVRVRHHRLPGGVLERVRPRAAPEFVARRRRSCSTWRWWPSAAPGRAATSAPRCSCSATSCCSCVLVALGLALLFEPERARPHPARGRRRAARSRTSSSRSRSCSWRSAASTPPPGWPARWRSGARGCGG